MTHFRPILARMTMQMVFVDFLLILVYVLATKMVGYQPQFPDALLVAAIILVNWVQILSVWYQCATIAVKESTQEAVKDEHPTVDPWELQKALMRASSQPMPVFPTLNRNGLLYAALMMEESAETYAALSAMMAPAAKNRSPQEMSAALVIQLLFRGQAENLTTASKHLRELLQDISFEYAMTQDEAIEVLDGTTDVSVVNSGFALACGLPGGAAYLEVVCSNLSKANPVTGVIDKDASGKWIKGADYFKPDLAKVLHQAGAVW